MKFNFYNYSFKSNLFSKIEVGSTRMILFLLVAGSFTACDKEELIKINYETSTIKDTEGNEYKTVKIGNQWWMAENLKSTMFNSGKVIYEINSTETWNGNTKPAYCQYDNTAQVSGLLYNHYVVQSEEEIAPIGWHIPTDEDWKKLERYLGMSITAIDATNWRGESEGNKLKIEAENSGWTFYDGVWPTNESGFSAIGGSCRFYEGEYGIPGLKGSAFFWTATTQNENEAWYRYLDYQKSSIFRYFGDYNYGFSIRCVKD